MKKRLNDKELDKNLKSLNDINRNESVKQRSYYQIMNKVNEDEPKRSYLFAKIISPIILSLFTLSLIVFLVINLFHEEDNVDKPQSLNQDSASKVNQPNLEGNEFTPESIQIGDDLANMKLIDGEYKNNVLTRGVFEGDISLSGTVYFSETNPNELVFHMDTKQSNPLPRPVDNKTPGTLGVENQDWLIQSLEAKQGDSFDVTLDITKYIVFTTPNSQMNKINISGVSVITKNITHLSNGGTFQNNHGEYGYSFLIPEAWQDNLLIEEKASNREIGQEDITTFWYTCKKDKTQQMYGQLTVSKIADQTNHYENDTSQSNKFTIYSNGYKYVYQYPLDNILTEPECVDDYIERFQTAFKEKPITDYFKLTK